MKTRYAEGIFYPSDKAELDALVKVERKDGDARAIIVPHQSLLKCAPLLREAFSHVGECRRVIILSPLHAPRLASDKDDCLFEGDLLPQSNMFLLGLKNAEHYAEEEPAAEIVVPFIEANLPQSRWCIIYCDVKTAKESKKLSAILEKENDGDTLFVISSNLSERTKDSEDTALWKKAALEALENGEFLLDKVNKNQAHLCGAGIIDALSRVMDGRWVKVADEEDDTITAHTALVRTR